MKLLMSEIVGMYEVAEGQQKSAMGAFMDLPKSIKPGYCLAKLDILLSNEFSAFERARVSLIRYYSTENPGEESAQGDRDISVLPKWLPAWIDEIETLLSQEVEVPGEKVHLSLTRDISPSAKIPTTVIRALMPILEIEE